MSKRHPESVHEPVDDRALRAMQEALDRRDNGGR